VDGCEKKKKKKKEKCKEEASEEQRGKSAHYQRGCACCVCCKTEGEKGLLRHRVAVAFEAVDFRERFVGALAAGQRRLGFLQRRGPLARLGRQLGLLLRHERGVVGARLHVHPKERALRLLDVVVDFEHRLQLQQRFLRLQKTNTKNEKKRRRSKTNTRRRAKGTRAPQFAATLSECKLVRVCESVREGGGGNRSLLFPRLRRRRAAFCRTRQRFPSCFPNRFWTLGSPSRRAPGPWPF
jgi:hypothetical protein